MAGNTKYLHLLSAVLLLLFNISANAKVSDVVELLYSKFPDIDKVCFLLSAVDETDYYHTFATKAQINGTNPIREADSGLVADTMTVKRITGYSYDYVEYSFARIVRALFEHDYPDLRLLWTCSQCCPAQKYYGNDAQLNDNGFIVRDTVCKDRSESRLELFSLPLAKIIAEYFKFDYTRPLVNIVTPEGAVGYRGVINKKKITEESQKLSFLTGLFFCGSCREVEESEKYNDKDKRYYYTAYQVFIFNSPATVKMAVKFLRELGCKQVRCTEKNPYYQNIVFKPSQKVLEKVLLSREMWELIEPLIL